MRDAVYEDGSAETRFAAEELRLRAALHSYIARILSTAVPVPGSDYVASIMRPFERSLEGADDGALADETTAALRAARRSVEEDAQREQERFAVDRTRLVRGLKANNPVKPPYESLRTTPNDALDAIASIAGLYRAAGYELLADNADRPDALATECLFMAQLYEERAEAALGGDGASSANGRAGGEERLRATQRDFIMRHLGAWAPAYCDEAASHAQSQVFRALMLVARDFIEEERRAWL